jgi:hypothetical protein
MSHTGRLEINLLLVASILIPVDGTNSKNQDKTKSLTFLYWMISDVNVKELLTIYNSVSGI